MSEDYRRGWCNNCERETWLEDCVCMDCGSYMGRKIPLDYREADEDEGDPYLDGGNDE